MSKLYKLAVLLLCLCLLIFTLSSCDLYVIMPGLSSITEINSSPSSYYNTLQTVTVSVAKGEHFHVTSPNPLRLARGEDALFSISIDDGYRYVGSSPDASFSDGVLRLSAVLYPTTVEIQIEKVDEQITPDTPVTPEHTHTGGEATCSVRARCEICDKEYGDLADHTPTSQIISDGDGHWKACKTEGCQVKLNYSTHTVGTPAKCESSAVCAICFSSYGDPTGHALDTDYYASNMIHWQVCTNPGCDKRLNMEEHSGGEATATEKAVCEVCLSPYGTVLGEEEKPHVHSGGTPDCTHPASCYECGEEYGDPLGHDWQDEISYNETHHWYECKREGCDKLKTHARHTGGSATHLALAVCIICKQPYGELAPPPEFEDIYLKADAADEGYHFICWSADLPITEGGKVFATESEGTFKIPYGKAPVANYADNEHFVILYRTSGGATSDGKDYYYQAFSNAHYTIPNTLYQDGTFSREGYVLAGYNEKEDGSGEVVTMGGKVLTNENGFKELFLQWAKIDTDGMLFTTYTDGENNYAAVTGYIDSTETMVVPEKVTARGTDYTVKEIRAGAFEGADMKALVLPSTLETIADGAFKNCTSLNRLTLHDNILNVSDKAFSGCTSLSKIYLNAGRAPCHAGNGEGMCSVKYSRLRLAHESGQKKMVVVSGSSSLYGLSGKMMQEVFPDYVVVNYGTNADVSTVFYIDAFMQFFDEGDIIIQAPETVNGQQMGSNKITWRAFRGCESMYEAFSFVDMTKYVGFFDALSEFNRTVRNTMSPSKDGYESWSNFINEYGDIIGLGDAPTFAATENSNPTNTGLLTEERFARFNNLYERASDKGVIMYMSFAPVDVATCTQNSRKADVQLSYETKLQELLDYPLISKISDYMLAHSLFYNSNYHPGISGRSLRTERLIADLKGQMILDGIIRE